MGKRQRRKRRPASNPRWWSALSWERIRRWTGRAMLVTLVGGAATGVWVGISRLDAHVQARLLAEHPQADFHFLDLPGEVQPLAAADLHNAVADLVDLSWTDDRLCRMAAERLSAVAWVDQVHFVRRTGDARLEISARYRLPVALVQHESGFFLVDAQGVRLPGHYDYDPHWRLIQGVRNPPPQAGAVWPGDDLNAGLGVLEHVEREAFAQQITAVIVDNHNGRVNVRASHIELATDRAGGRIRWGSAPGREFEENTIPQKLVLMRANYVETGRVDAGHAVIDIATFPDRITVPESSTGHLQGRTAGRGR